MDTFGKRISSQVILEIQFSAYRSRKLQFKAVVHRRNSRPVSHHAHEKEFRDGHVLVVRKRERKRHGMSIRGP
jgi:hypothetical protein